MYKSVYRKLAQQSLRGPFLCPLCWNVTVSVRYSGKHVIVQCSKCGILGVLERIPGDVFQKTDYYHMVLDRYLEVYESEEEQDLCEFTT